MLVSAIVNCVSLPVIKNISDLIDGDINEHFILILMNTLKVLCFLKCVDIWKAGVSAG